MQPLRPVDLAALVLKCLEKDKELRHQTAAEIHAELGSRVRVVAVTAGLIRTEQAHLHYGDEQAIAAVAASRLVST